MGLPVHEVSDQLEELRDYALLETQYDLNYRDVVYSLLPVTNSFIYREVARIRGYENNVRKRLNDWYLAREIADPAQRELVQQVRRGQRNPELGLAAVAKNALANGDFDTAEQFFKASIERNPSNWRVHKDLAEFYRHNRGETAMAIQHYRYAAEHAPKQGPDRVLIFREYGMVLRGSGMPNAYNLAAEQLEIAHTLEPGEPICRHALGDCYVKAGRYVRAAEVLEPLRDHTSKVTRQKTHPLLLECYERTGELLKAAEIKQLAASDR